MENKIIGQIINEKLIDGDWFLWVSSRKGDYEIHKYHSDAGYGIKTYTGYDEKDGSSVLVNWSGCVGKVVLNK